MLEINAPSDILTDACKVLGLVDGCLLQATNGPVLNNTAEWADKGDWLKLAHSLQAKSVFFVENEPVLILANLPDGLNEAEFFNQIWCMARPQMLFLARDGELAVYKLSAPPVGNQELTGSRDRLLALAESSADILEKLADFTRESIESGRLFGEQRFGSGYYRADRALVHDLKIVRARLTSDPEPLSDESAHALIGRALFVRYLEDRQILVPEYFSDIASINASWVATLNQSPGVFAESHHKDLHFFRVLGDRELTYAFFDQLTTDFNGDTFPVTPRERNEVKAHHLKLLCDLLTGAADNQVQGQLFLFAYRFDIIPIELISSIYEEFYTAKRGKGNTQSSYYTPPALADFLLARTLTADVLERKPRIIDAACGSGIFLVEAFRRIVRYRVVKQDRHLSQRELRVILRDQIRGIDLNPDAVPVAAFSLYLAYLHYQDPREVNERRRLPNLRWVEERENRDPDQHLDILYAGNAFEAIVHEHPIVRKHFGPGSSDVVVGNPPWGEVKPSDILGRSAMPATKAWLEADTARVIGDNELSQAFVHLALALLKDGGKAALLLSSGVLFKQHDKSRAFRQSWLAHCKLEQVVNFAHVRHIFFADPVRPGRGNRSVRESDGSSPFISATFQKGSPHLDHRFSYWSARRTANIENTRALILSRTDMHQLRQDDCRRNENLWKLYWWGGRRDEGLIRDLERFDSLSDVCLSFNPANLSTQGYTPGKSLNAPAWYSEFEELPVANFTRYDSPVEMIKSPILVHRPGKQSTFSSPRLMLKHGVGSNSERPVVSRLARESFLVSNAVNCFPMTGASDTQMLCVLGIAWSSISTYFFWLTASSWGMWHDEIQKYVAGKLPIALPQDANLTKRLVKIVTALMTLDTPKSSLLAILDASAHRLEKARKNKITLLELELDEVVFDLYELNEADRDLVRDMCNFGLDFFYRRGKSIAVQPVLMPKLLHGTARDLSSERAHGLGGYLQVFLSQWNADLAPDGELSWEIILGPTNSSILAVLFSTVSTGAATIYAQQKSVHAWQDVLNRISNQVLRPLGTTGTIYTDTFVRAVSEHEILIVKRNEARHWTRSMAREDADATTNQAMRLADQAVRH